MEAILARPPATRSTPMMTDEIEATTIEATIVAAIEAVVAPTAMAEDGELNWIRFNRRWA